MVGCSPVEWPVRGIERCGADNWSRGYDSEVFGDDAALLRYEGGVGEVALFQDLGRQMCGVHSMWLEI